MKFLISAYSSTTECPEPDGVDGVEITLFAGALAIYKCEDPGDIVTGGDEIRICNKDLSWSGEEPVCGECSQIANLVGSTLKPN